MEIVSTQKFIRMSPRKLRRVADMVRGLKPQEAVDILQMSSQRAALPISKVIKSAIGNAIDRGLEPQNLLLKEIQIGEGPILKRFRPVSRGRAHSIQKKMSHIRVVLESKPKKK